MKLLVVEDDLLLQRGLEKALIQESYTVDIAHNLETAKHFLSYGADIYSAVLLDLGLPDGNGLTLLKWLRESKYHVPVLIITARDALNDRIIGLDSGADDYLVKPFELVELYARLRAIIRRHCGQADNHLIIDAFILNLTNQTIMYFDKPLELTVREYVVLSRLLLKYQQVVPRELLLQDLYSWQDSLGSNTLEVYIHRLRQKIGKDRIQTIRGLGYQLVDAV
ncbi:response regulator [Wohlfahrtiimonas larvae]|uniref:Two-component system response regulator PmrA n=1 Tax=Wohlfahrtiimonas larvae TaxID=1157986 RepID=A0ABP9MCW3_9GAMM|nr:response regulator [Wohlfahrtiimonas larvae]